MSTLSQLTVEVLTARLTKKDALEELQKEIAAVGASLKADDNGVEIMEEPQAEESQKRDHPISK
ncbi:MAG: hypothetical protein ACOYL3_15930 [Desulfuromonadaceae bacterium]